MTSSNRRAWIGHKGRTWSSSCWGIALVSALLLALASQANARPCSADPRLSATLMGRLEPGANGRIAVRWDGPEGTLLDVWVDLDGDDVLASYELVAEGRPLAPGIEVVSFELPGGVPVVAEPKVWVRARAGVWNDAAATLVGTLSGDGRDECGWQPGFTLGFEGAASAMRVYDDGSGPALYVGGSFETAGDVTVNGIARWNSGGWSALAGPSGTGVDGSVHTLVVFDDGSGPALYAGGSFDTAGGVVTNYIARWNGSAWSGLSGPSGTGVDGSVHTLAVFDDGSGPALYAGGRFDTAGGMTVNNIARWDGTAWSDLKGGVSIPPSPAEWPYVFALAVLDDGSGLALYAGGRFETAGDATVINIARWNGSEWSDLSGPGGTGVGNGSWTPVRTLAVHDDGTGTALYAGGEFDSAGGVTVNNIARWGGSEWSDLSGPGGTGVSDSVYSLAVHDDGSGPALYSGGSFDTAGGVTVNGIARWDTSGWSALSGPSGTGVNGGVGALTVFDDGSGPALYAGGWFTTAGGVVADHIARWKGSEWSGLSGSCGAGADGSVAAIAVFDDGFGPALYAGGWFESAGCAPVNQIARWDGTAWSDLSGPSGTGVGGSVGALAVFDDGTDSALYAGGLFLDAGGVTANNIARWDGTAWSALSGPTGTGVNNRVWALAIFDDGSGPNLYVGGDFYTAGGVTVNGIARWDGTYWSPAGLGVAAGGYSSVKALAVFDDGSGSALYAGGSFDTAGGVTVNNIARWNGSAWSVLSGPSGTGVDGSVHTLAVHDDGTGPALYAGGGFTTAGGVTVNGIARWNGSAWSALGGPSGTGMGGPIYAVYALAEFDDGSGPALYAGGLFDTAGGLTVNYIARWNDSAWSALSGPSGTGMGGPDYAVYALAAFNDGSGPTLYAGGDFITAGGLASSRIAAWGCYLDAIFVDGFESGDTSAWSTVAP